MARTVTLAQFRAAVEELCTPAYPLPGGGHVHHPVIVARTDDGRAWRAYRFYGVHTAVGLTPEAAIIDLAEHYRGSGGG